jgi:hypothetical protein
VQEVSHNSIAIAFCGMLKDVEGNRMGKLHTSIILLFGVAFLPALTSFMPYS